MRSNLFPCHAWVGAQLLPLQALERIFFPMRRYLFVGRFGIRNARGSLTKKKGLQGPGLGLAERLDGWLVGWLCDVLACWVAGWLVRRMRNKNGCETPAQRAGLDWGLGFEYAH